MGKEPTREHQLYCRIHPSSPYTCRKCESMMIKGAVRTLNHDVYIWTLEIHCTKLAMLLTLCIRMNGTYAGSKGSARVGEASSLSTSSERRQCNMQFLVLRIRLGFRIPSSENELVLHSIWLYSKYSSIRTATSMQLVFVY